MTADFVENSGLGMLLWSVTTRDDGLGGEGSPINVSKTLRKQSLLSLVYAGVIPVTRVSDVLKGGRLYLIL